jgi:hypothetical protein
MKEYPVRLEDLRDDLFKSKDGPEDDETKGPEDAEEQVEVEEVVEEAEVDEEAVDKAIADLDEAIKKARKEGDKEEESEESEEESKEDESKVEKAGYGEDDDDDEDDMKMKRKRGKKGEKCAKALQDEIMGDEEVRKGFEVSDFLEALVTRVCEGLGEVQKSVVDSDEFQHGRTDALIDAIKGQTEAISELHKAIESYGDEPAGPPKSIQKAVDAEGVEVVEKGGHSEDVVTPGGQGSVTKAQTLEGLNALWEANPERMDVVEAISLLESTGEIKKSIATEAIGALKKG